MRHLPFSRKARDGLLALLSAGAVLTLALVHVGMESAAQRDAHRQSVEQIGFAFHDRIEHNLIAQLHLVQSLAAYVATNPQPTQAEFLLFAKHLTRGERGVRSLELAPGGVVRFVYPVQGNEQIVGTDLFTDPRARGQVAEAIGKRSLIVSGPKGLSRGALALVARLPVFVEPDEAGAGPGTFWGLATAVLDFQELMEEAGLLPLDPNLRLAIRGRDGLGAEGETFFGSSRLFEQDAVIVNVRLPTGSWQIALYPEQGWGQSPFAGQTGWSLLIGLGLAVALGILVFQLAQRPVLLEEAVRTTTEQLQLTEMRYRQLFESAPDGILIVDADSGSCIGANAKACQMLGRDVDALRGVCLCEMLLAPLVCDEPTAPTDWPARMLAAQRAVEGLILSRTGEDVPVEIVSAEVHAGERRLVQITLRDITERQAAQAELRKLSTVVERMPNAVVITDPHGAIEYVNPAFAQATGYGPEDVKGQNPRLLKSGRQPPEFYAEMWRRIGQGETWQGHFINRHRSGTLFEEDATIIPVLDDGGSTRHYIAIKTDVTDRVRLEKQLRQAQKMEAIGTLAGGIAHEFNNILTPVMGYSELLEARMAPESKELRYVSVIRNASHRARALVAQILQFSRLREGERSPIDLRPVVKEAMRLLEVALPANIEIVLDVASAPMMAVANSTEIHTVLMNLCVNARDAMPDGGTLAVRLHKVQLDGAHSAGRLGSPDGDYIRLEVSDTGTGIPDWALDKIFDPFFSTKGVGKGTGLGLATTYGIVTGHEGSIHVHSRPDTGTRFEVYLPASLTPGLGESEPTRQPAVGSGSVLLVDDDPFVLEFVQEALQSYGYTVETRDHGRSALRLLREEPLRFNVVVTDLSMPEMSGDQLIAEMQRHQVDLPVVLTTGHENIAKDQVAIVGLPFYLLPKPFTVFDVVDAVQRALEQHHHSRRSLDG